MPGTGLYRAFRRAGFVFNRGRFTLHCAALVDDLGLDELRDPCHWSLHGGDFDVL